MVYSIPLRGSTKLLFGTTHLSQFACLRGAFDARSQTADLVSSSHLRISKGTCTLHPRPYESNYSCRRKLSRGLVPRDVESKAAWMGIYILSIKPLHNLPLVSLFEINSLHFCACHLIFDAPSLSHSLHPESCVFLRRKDFFTSLSLSKWSQECQDFFATAPPRRITVMIGWSGAAFMKVVSFVITTTEGMRAICEKIDFVIVRSSGTMWQHIKRHLRATLLHAPLTPSLALPLTSSFSLCALFFVLFRSSIPILHSLSTSHFTTGTPPPLILSTWFHVRRARAHSPWSWSRTTPDAFGFFCAARIGSYRGTFGSPAISPPGGTPFLSAVQLARVCRPHINRPLTCCALSHHCSNSNTTSHGTTTTTISVVTSRPPPRHTNDKRAHPIAATTTGLPLLLRNDGGNSAAHSATQPRSTSHSLGPRPPPLDGRQQAR